MREGEGRRARLQGWVNGTPRPPPLRIFISCGFPQPPTSVHFGVSSTEAIIRVAPRLPVSGWWSLVVGLPRPLTRASPFLSFSLLSVIFLAFCRFKGLPAHLVCFLPQTWSQFFL